MSQYGLDSQVVQPKTNNILVSSVILMEIATQDQAASELVISVNVSSTTPNPVTTTIDSNKANLRALRFLS